jgi:hypothetical protein
MTKSQRDNAARWRRFAVLGQIKYGEAALRSISRDPKCSPAVRDEAEQVLSKVENLMIKYRETLK